MDKRPVIEIEKQGFDHLIEVLIVVLVITTFFLPLIYYTDMPESIPRHYDATGSPDGFWNKGFIWFLPLLSLLFVTGFKRLSKFPHRFNYSVKITSENAKEQYRHALRSLNILLVICLCSFLYILWVTIQFSLGKSSGLGSFFIFIFLGLIIGCVIYLAKGPGKN